MTGNELQERVLRLLNDDERQLLVTKIAGVAIGAFDRLPEDVQDHIREAMKETEKPPKPE